MDNSTCNINDLIGRPWKLKGRGPNEYDCYGIALEISRRLGNKIPDFGSVARAQCEAHVNGYRSLFKRIEEKPSPGDLLLMYDEETGRYGHIGVAINEKEFLTSTHQTGVIKCRISKNLQVIEGIYRYVGPRNPDKFG